MSGEAGHNVDCWLAIARQEKIVSLKCINGYNTNLISRETCILGYGLIFSKKRTLVAITDHFSEC